MKRRMAGFKVLSLLFGVYCFLQVANAGEGKKHKLVAYWGQNAVYNMHKEEQYWEKDLVHFCQNSKYDVIVLAFLHNFFAQQKDSLPGFNFAYHCTTAMSTTYPYLLRCPKIEDGIKECQRQGKQVLMSLGGASGSYGFANNGQATKFATTLWDLLFEGTDLTDIRPFGSAVLDGIDLDIEGGSSTGYSAFVQKFREYTSKSTTKNYIVSGAPQCPFPDAYLGPSPGKALGDVPTMFDEIYIQFYNNYCHTGDAEWFYKTLRLWLDYSAKENGPMIYVGIPSHIKATYGQGYWRTPQEMETIYQKIKDESRFGGFMIWDASFDQNHVINGKHYSEYIVDLIGQSHPVGTTTSTTTMSTTTYSTTAKPTTPTTTTTKAYTTTAKSTTATPETSTPTTTASSTTKYSTMQSTTASTTKKTTTTHSSGAISCIGKGQGIYSHPTDDRKFGICVQKVDTAYMFDCPISLYFNCEKKTCDYVAKRDC